MKNTKFIFKLILALAPLIAVVLFTALYPYGYMDEEYPAWAFTKSVVCTKTANSPDLTTDNQETLILGDSRAMADLIPEMMTDHTLAGSCVTNLAVGGATSIEMYYTLKNYINNNGAPKNAVIMFAPFHYSIIDNFWTRTAYFNYLSISDMSELYDYAKATKSETLLKDGYLNDLVSLRMRFPDKYLPALVNAKFVTRYNLNKDALSRISSDRGYGPFGTADGCDYLNYECKYESMHKTGDAVLLDVYLNRLLKLCSESGINTVLVVPPMNEASFNELHDSYVEEFTSYLDELNIKYPAILVDGDIPCYDNSYFGDSSHLNRKGAEKFTKEFVNKYFN